MDAQGWTDQPSRHRVVIEGRLASDGSRSTLVFEPVDGGWLVHLWGLSNDAIRITADQAAQIAEGMSAA
jgi:hypothetical protein